MKTILILSAILVASFLVIGSGQNSSSQEFQTARLKETAAALDQEQQKELLRPVLAELLKDREFKRELVKEITRSMGPEAVKALADSIASECARDPQLRKEVLRLVVGAATSQFKEIFASASHGNRSMNQATLMSLVSAVTSRGIAGGRTPSSGKSLGGRAGDVRATHGSTELSGDFLRVFVSPENQIKTLSTYEIRKLFTGEFTNWNQVGGPDLAVKVVAWNEGTRALEDLVGQSVAPEAVRVRYLSLVIPAVSRSRGAVGFLPATLAEELPFIERHEAIRKVSITSDADVRPETARRKGPEDSVVGGTGSGTPPEDRQRPLVTLIAK